MPPLLNCLGGERYDRALHRPGWPRPCFIVKGWPWTSDHPVSPLEELEGPSRATMPGSGCDYEQHINMALGQRLLTWNTPGLWHHTSVVFPWLFYHKQESSLRTAKPRWRKTEFVSLSKWGHCLELFQLVSLGQTQNHFLESSSKFSRWLTCCSIPFPGFL